MKTENNHTSPIIMSTNERGDYHEPNLERDVISSWWLGNIFIDPRLWA